MGALEGGRVVGAVACDGHHLVVGLEGLDKAFLVERAGAGDDFEVADTLEQFLVREFLEFRAGDYVAVRVLRGPQADLSSDFAGSGGGVAGDNLDFDARVDGLAYGGWHIGPDGV